MSLLKPLQLGPYTLKNRVFLSALTRDRATPRTIPTELMKSYYQQRAGGGLLVTEGTLIVQQGTEWPNAPGIWNAEQIAGWKKIVDTVHDAGSIIFAQLWHLGRVSHPDMPEQIAAGTPVYGPSAVAAKGGKFRYLPGQPGYVTPTAIQDPSTIIAQYKQAAINAKEAGFDGVELHGANGYLVAQFLEKHSNTRTDQWGGSVENRARFGLEALKVLIEVFGADKVALKVTPGGGYNDMGMPLEDALETFKYFISEAIKLGIVYVAVPRYSPLMDPTSRGTPHDVIENYGSLFKNTKTKFFTNSGFTPEEAEKVVSDSTNTVEGIFFGMPFLAHPDLPKRIEHGKALDNALDFTTFYSHPGDLSKGYTDYPAATYV